MRQSYIDFSENFNCQYFAEIQSAHFGSSNKTVSLHTVMFYAFNCKPVPICTISDICRHDSSAIFAHLKPVFQYVNKEYPKVKAIHIISYSPSNQYRNRYTIYLFFTQIEILV